MDAESDYNRSRPIVSIWSDEDEHRWEEYVRAMLEARYEIRRIHAYIEELCLSLERLRSQPELKRLDYLKRHVVKNEILTPEQKTKANLELQRSRWTHWKIDTEMVKKMYDSLVWYEAGQG